MSDWSQALSGFRADKGSAPTFSGTRSRYSADTVRTPATFANSRASRSWSVVTTPAARTRPPRLRAGTALTVMTSAPIRSISRLAASAPRCPIDSATTSPATTIATPSAASSERTGRRYTIRSAIAEQIASARTVTSRARPPMDAAWPRAAPAGIRRPCRWQCSPRSRPRPRTTMERARSPSCAPPARSRRAR